MALSVNRRVDVEKIYFQPACPGYRAVFMVETPTKKDVRTCRELFDMVGTLAEVVPLAHGRIMAFAVQVTEDDGLFSKIDSVLKAQFPFSVVEHGWSDVTYDLLQTLCEDSGSRLNELPECGVCRGAEPFPSRAGVELQDQSEPVQVTYCLPCVAEHWRTSAGHSVRRLVSQDHRRFRVGRTVRVVILRPIQVETAPAGMAV